MKILTALVVLVVLLSVTAALAQPAANPARPWETWQPPVVTLPNPNGFDVYLKAFVLKAEIDRAHGLPKPGAPPGAPPPQLPKPGAEGPPFPATTPARDPWGEGPPDLPLGQRVALYDGVLKLARQAMAEECRIPLPADMEEAMPYFAQFRAVARLFAMESAAHREAGEVGAAANSALDAMRVSQAAASQGSLISFLVGIACEAVGGKQLDAAIPLLNGKGCTAALVRLRELGAKRMSLADALAGEEPLARVEFRRLAANPTDLNGLLTEKGRQELTSEADRAAYLVGAWQALGDRLSEMRRIAREPYHVHEPLPATPDPIADLFAIDATPSMFKDAQARTMSSLRQLHLAARAFFLDHKHLPQTLSELVPDYLPKVPSDPFYIGPLKSHLNGDALVIYSVGPDGVDDGGEAFVGNVLTADSKGDVVVRVNPK